MSPDDSTPWWVAEFRSIDTLGVAASPSNRQSRGRRFEKVLSGMFADSALEPRLSYRPRGEEIDGSIWFEGRTILVEAKWTAEPHPASNLYQFRGKVDGKIEGTLGAYFSMSGFSRDAVDALIAGKNLNLILFDDSDIRRIVDGHYTAFQAIKVKLRAAGDRGTPFYPLPASATHGNGTASQPPSRLTAVVVEGERDRVLLEALLAIGEISFEGEILSAGGQVNLALVADALAETGRFQRVIILTEDDSPLRSPEFVSGLPRAQHVTIIPVGRGLETLIGIDDSRLRGLAVEHRNSQLRDLLATHRDGWSDRLRNILERLGSEGEQTERSNRIGRPSPGRSR